jgi:hypothetical protein
MENYLQPKVTSSKLKKINRFRLFFDHTSNNHQGAKKELETLKGKQVQLVDEFDFLDESLMQTIAEIQVPEIHNPKFGQLFYQSKN